MAEFPLLRLPFIPLKYVMNRMYIGDLTAFYVCSKKTCEAVKSAKMGLSHDSMSDKQKICLTAMEILKLFIIEVQSNPITTTITVSDGIEIKVDNGIQTLFFYVENMNRQDRYPGKRGNIDIGGISVPAVMKENHKIFTFWNEDSDGLENLLNYFKTFLNASIDICINGSWKAEFFQNLRMVVKTIHKHTVNRCRVHNREHIEYNDYKFILDNINPALNFDVVGIKNHFEHNKPFTSKNVEIKPANWLTFENFLSMNCEHIVLLKTRFTNDHMKTFIRQWLNGRYPKLKRLNVELQEIVNVENILPDRPTNYGYYIHINPGSVCSALIKRHRLTVAKISNDTRSVPPNMMAMDIYVQIN